MRTRLIDRNLPLFALLGSHDQEPNLITSGRLSRGKRDAGSARHLGVFGGVEIQRQRAAAHGFDQGWMGAADFGRVDVPVAVRAQFAITVAIDRAGDDDARISGVADFGDVVGGVGRVAD